jgi:16S rRNA C967 or C1407 C5-methylase (RsmB/RsmF family)/NOL1/NOP2/fmu family ribosome biogenesis protein
MSLPEKFVERVKREMGVEQGEALCRSLLGVAPTSIRLNPHKPFAQPEGRDLPWNKYGRYLDVRPSFTLDVGFNAGTYYVQEAGSQFVGHILEGMNLQGVRLLDMCAAPGGKTTLYSTLVGESGLVVANEIVRNRASILADNVRKWGVGNVVVTSNEPRHIAAFESWFDVVAVDAPCSGEGMFRKDEQSRSEWSEGNVKMCAVRQAEILDEAWKTLADGGLLIYSTCTFNQDENEGTIQAFSERVDGEIMESETIVCPEEWGIKCGRVGVWQTFRFYPHSTQSEGFFAAVARKSTTGSRRANPKPRRKIMNEIGGKRKEELSRWVEQPKAMRFAEVAETCYAYYAEVYDDVKLLAESLSVIYSGVAMGRIFGTTLKPDAALAFFAGLRRDAIARTSLEKEDALQYLRKAELAAEKFTEGMNLVECNGCALGFAKRIGNRCNNLFPNSLRILKTDL